MRAVAGAALVVIFAGGMALLVDTIGYPPAVTVVIGGITAYMVARCVWRRLP